MSWVKISWRLRRSGRDLTALSFAPTEPATVKLLDVNGMRTEAPMLMPALKIASRMPTVRTKKNPPQPQPQPRLRNPPRARRSSIPMSLSDLH